MPTCCLNSYRYPSRAIGRRPRIVISTYMARETKPDGKRGDMKRFWGATVGSSMLDGFSSRESVLKEAKKVQAEERVLRCGHVIPAGKTVLEHVSGQEKLW